MKLAEQKAKAGQTKAVEKLETAEEAPRKGADVVDLTELLKRSLGRGAKSAGEEAPEKKSTKNGKVTPIKRAAASQKTPARRRAA
jgi:DNA end-binding protein Ku